MLKIICFFKGAGGVRLGHRLSRLSGWSNPLAALTESGGLLGDLHGDAGDGEGMKSWNVQEIRSDVYVDRSAACALVWKEVVPGGKLVRVRVPGTDRTRYG